MLSKIALSTIKHRLKDFIVLFTGLTIAVAIFFMFTTIANNRAFLEANSTIRQITLIFVVGEFLLGFITLIYLTFANNFLLQLRQREYGLLMMYGATKSQVSQLLFRETLILGSLASVVGIFVGMALTAIAGHVLQKLLYLNLPHWQFFNGRGLIVTIVFFAVILTINGIWNVLHLKRTQLNDLLHANQVNEKLPTKMGRYFIFGILGIILMILSFIIMHKIAQMGLMGLILALILNVSGTFLIIRASLILILNVLQKLTGSYKGLRRFTIGQLTFRLSAFDKLLTIVTLMFALALGALSVGRGFQMTVPILASQNSAYTIAIKDPTKQETANIDKLTGVTFKTTYQYKMVNKAKLYLSKAEFSQVNLPVLATNGTMRTQVSLKIPKTTYADAKELANKYPSALNQLLVNITANNMGAIDASFLNKTAFAVAKGQSGSITVIRVKDYTANETSLAALVKSQMANHSDFSTDTITGTYPCVQLLRSYMGGVEFMGFFLAIAFLTMLASTLMFKVLSNTAIDKKRYRILSMIGANTSLLKQTNAKEIGVIFGIPMIIGFLDVWFGLPMFKPIMGNVYLGFGFAAVVVVILYVLYYLLTVFLYQKILALKQKHN
ncbi:FtsX-like permease family protein [Periweissella beninensis]|uniref:FtsX-like permease family protein n=1 Tax=Periweissella beninensis TaxID=504936 RepID=UPI0021A4B0A8|nr:ABC transporter permease [Periweissella beninensis]MCT4395492.1 ABC transporter permease [Periweissella beninensis]